MIDFKGMAMIKILKGLGIASIVFGVLGGIWADVGLGGVLIGVIGGFVGSAIYFALAMVLENQKAVMAKLFEKPSELVVPPRELSGRKCSKCGAEYDREMVCCPYCIHRVE